MTKDEHERNPAAASWLREALGLEGDGTPFPWQTELQTRFHEGKIPTAIDIPTGLGKTAVMAVWLVARAAGAKIPRRLVYVVDRRAVVDQATEVAVGLRGFVDRNQDIKRRLGLKGTRSLPVSTLRGQYVDNRDWLEDPASPAIVVGTVDMIGSRLLFEGYGVSRKMRPYHAGLLGADTLLVLDEAHLVPPFEQLLWTIANDRVFRPREQALQEIVPSFNLMALSATGRTTRGAVFGLTPADFEHTVVAKRLAGRKSLRLQLLREDAEFEERLARSAWELSGNGRSIMRCIVFCDRRDTTEKAKRALDKLAKGIAVDCELFVGGRRVFEREDARDWLKRHGFLAGIRVERSRPAFLFATSAGEVGVDLDADHMVCDLVAWERMVQRLGRVNRRGDGDAKVVVLVGPEPQASKKEQEALAKNREDLRDKEHALIETFERRVRQWKNQQAPFESLAQINGGLDANLGALHALKQRAQTDLELAKRLNDATTRAPLRPALTRALVDAWSLTSLEQHTGRPAIDPWLRGWIDRDPQTAVVWRTHLPVRSGPRQSTRKEVEAFFEAAPPHASEILETETFDVLAWLLKRAKVIRALAERPDAETGQMRPPGREDVVGFVLARAGELRRALRVDDLVVTDDGGAEKDRRQALHSELSGAILVVDSRVAGLKHGLLDEDENTAPRTADDGQEWLGEHVVGFRIRSTSSDQAVVIDVAWRERLRFAAEISPEGDPQRLLVVEKWRHAAANEEDRSAARPQLLDIHQSWAEERARALALDLLPADLTNERKHDYVEMLAAAARIHDEGKRVRRWQRAFNAPQNGSYAKTRGPINFALLDGYRHELGSLLYAHNDERLKRLPEDLRDLALHLIAAHHGFARPVIGTSGCEDAPPSVLEGRARETALRFARLQRRWGPWGLAWWESLLRAADQQASRDNDAAESDVDAKAV